MSLNNPQTMPVFDPFRLAERSFVIRALFVAAGTMILALASRIAVPMVPVPITMQTFAVTMIGALYGWRLGGLTVLAWVVEGLAGLPVWTNGASGVPYFLGATGGYLVSFPLVAMLAGWLSEKGWTGNRVIASFAAHFSANILCLAIGGVWLGAMIGAEKAWLLGVMPFFLGAALKSALAAAVLKGVAIYGGKPQIDA
ncbi:biotin transporter BioY [Rhizobium sp. XQZ8]|uniref:biotin transporter BioY n=1 Tax=Rhizobium populisoli TaxID=2859785 RepID=UPI001C66E4C7|nr:biotin transporter BioY [Rhizobium populisoli]MBW6421037.1 biotin transporter BioY [Rhizobium populisoli]